MLEKLKKWFGIAVNYNFTTPRICLSAFIKALDKCDVNEDGEINAKELFKLYKDSLAELTVGQGMTTSEIKAFIDDFCNRA